MITPADLAAATKFILDGPEESSTGENGGMARREPRPTSVSSVASCSKPATQDDDLAAALFHRMAVDNAEGGASALRLGHLRLAKSLLTQCIAEIEHLERMQAR